jgi:rhodanese-related sulfurtransferase
MRWIENVSRDAVRNGHHTDMGENAMLIQIADPATFFPEPKHSFKEIHQFEFLDADDGFPDEVLVTQEQADELVRLLQHALDNSMNVLVHCHAGICRSGAVVEVGSMMGFTPTERFRMPNLRVKHFMMKALGLTYDSDEKPSWTNGWVSESGIVMPNGDFE